MSCDVHSQINCASVVTCSCYKEQIQISRLYNNVFLSSRLIEFVTAMSPGNATDLPKLTEQIDVPTLSSLLPPIEQKGKQNFKQKEKNASVRNRANKVIKLKSEYIKMRQQDTDLRQQIGLLEAELAEAQAKLKASMTEDSKVQSFPRSGSTRRYKNKELKPLIVPKAPNGKKKVILAILPKSTMNELQNQKSKSMELPILKEKKGHDELKTYTPKKTGRNSEKINIGEHVKLPNISNHGPYFKDCSKVFRSSASVKTPVITKRDHHSGNTEYLSISQSLDNGDKPKLANSDVNISQNSRFLPPITQEHKKVEKSEKNDNVRSDSKKLKLPDIYSPTKNATPPEKIRSSHKLPNVFSKLKKAKVYPQD